MGWLIRERRGPSWKQGWAEQALASIAPPPRPLLAVLGILVILLSVSSYSSYRSQVKRTKVNFKIFFLLLPLVFVFVGNSIVRYGRLVIITPRTKLEPVYVAEGTAASPWGAAALLVVLLVLISYQPYFHSKWFPSIWRPYYY
ncbi:hypothetical protein SDJN02_17139, partial [Cucurbita argyrosperma subsp. argyrosperma]